MAHHVKHEENGKLTIWDVTMDRGPLRESTFKGTQEVRKRWRHRHKVDQRHRLDLTVTLRGGPEALYLVNSRGALGLIEGHRAIHDIVREITQGEEWYWDMT